MDTLVEVVKHGSALHVDTALQKLASQLNKPSSTEIFPLHVAVWRNHLPIIELLLSAGAFTSCADGESGWTPLHRALYLGHLAGAARLLQAGASVEALDLQGRTPVDLVSCELSRLPTAGTAPCSAIFCWGSGANFQLGTGSTDFHLNPLRVETLQGLRVVLVAAAKFHSAALTADGRLLTWGWGRGGRLGHPDYNIHSGETALITPWQVAGLGRRAVVAVAAGKHHMLAATSAGEVWSWGGNRDGKLGYPNVDTQPTPRKVDFRGRAEQVAASNRHSACLTAAGEIWTWGANHEGQLGYGTNNSANNPTPRLVEAMKGKALVAVSLSKRHSVVLTADGDTYTWGHRVVTPRRVPLAGCRDTARLAATNQQPGPQQQQQQTGAAAAASEVRFHRNHSEVVRPEAVLVAAGYEHTSVVTRGGVVLTWRSADPTLRPMEVGGALAGRRVVGLAASKTRTVVVTDTGLVFMWEVGKDRTAAGGGGGSVTATAAAGMGAGGPMTGMGAAAASGGSVTAAAGLGSGGGTVAGGDSAAALIVPTRVPGLTHIVQVAVGEKHTLALQVWTMPPMPDEHGVMPPSVARRRRRQRSDASGGSDSSESEDGGGGGSASGGWWRTPLGASSFSQRTSSGGASLSQSASRAGMSGRGLAAAGVAASPGLPATPPPGVPSPAARSWGLGGGDLIPSPGPSSFGGGGSLMGLLSYRGRRGGGGRVGGNLLAELQEPPGPGWELFSHRPACDDSIMALPYDRRRHTSSGGGGGEDDDDDMFRFADADGAGLDSRRRSDGSGGRGFVPSLQVLCQRTVATQLVHPRTALPILEYADAAGAALLRCYCLAVTIANLDVTLIEAPAGLTNLPSHLQAELEHLYRSALLVPLLTAVAPPPPSTSTPPAMSASASATALFTAPTPSAGPLPYRTAAGSSPFPFADGGGSGSLLGSSPPPSSTLSATASDASLTALEAFHRRRTLLSRLQPGRRPSAAPSWLEGAAAAERMAPQASSRMAAAALAALDAIGHGMMEATQAAEGTDQAGGLGGATAAGGSVGAGGDIAGGETEAGEVQRLVRQLQRKLEQIAGLEARRRAGQQLDGQQQAKMSQRGALQEALQALAAGASVDVVRQAIAHCSQVAARLATAKLDSPASTPAAAAARGPTLVGGPNTPSTAMEPACSVSSGGPSISRQEVPVRGGQQEGNLAAAAPSAASGSKSSSSKSRTGSKGAVAAAAEGESPPPPCTTTGGRAGGGSGAGTSTSVVIAAVPTAAGEPSGESSSSSGLAGGGRFSEHGYPAAATAAASPHPSTPVPPTGLKPSASGAAPTSGGSSSSSTAKKQQRRGGLSMFLSGALDQPLSSPAPPALPALAASPGGAAVTTPGASKGPAWGGAKLPSVPAGVSSLRELLTPVQQQQAPSAGTGPQAQQQTPAQQQQQHGGGPAAAATTAATPPSTGPPAGRSSSDVGSLAAGGATTCRKSSTVPHSSAPQSSPFTTHSVGTSSNGTGSSLPIAASADTGGAFGSSGGSGTNAVPAGIAVSKSTSSRKPPAGSSAAGGAAGAPPPAMHSPGTPVDVRSSVAAAPAGPSSQAAGWTIAAAAGGSNSNAGGGGCGSGVRLTLAEFMSGRPITAPLAVVSQRGGRQEAAKELAKEPAGPAWGAAVVQGSSPAGARSLLDIQAEQAQAAKRAAVSLANRQAAAATAAASSLSAPGGAGGGTAGSSSAAGGMAPSGASPPASRTVGPLTGALQAAGGAPPQQPSKWYVPEQCQPAVVSKPLTAIQIEERAIKEIAARYGGRVVARVVAVDGGAEGVTSACSGPAVGGEGSSTGGRRGGAGATGVAGGAGSGSPGVEGADGGGGGKGNRSRRRAGRAQAVAS